MRRTIATAGALAVLAPLLLAGASSAGASTAGSLTVSVTGRDGGSGAAVAGTGLSAVNRTTGLSYGLTPGTTKTLPDGDYAVLADIKTAADQTHTLAGKTVTVSGATKLSFDARAGKPVHLAFSPAAPGGSANRLTQLATVCAAGVQQSAWHAQPGTVYAVASSSPVFRMGYGLLSSSTNVNGDDAYYLAGGVHGGIPAGLTATFPTSSLASVDVSERGGLESGPRPYVDVDSASDDGCYSSIADLEFQATLPAYYTVHVLAGNCPGPTRPR